MSSELPLFPPGFHDLSIDSLYSVFVEPFPGSLNRPRLLKGLEEIISILLGFPLTAEIWINGSFSTRKNDPGDVDVLILTNIAQLNSLSLLQQHALRNLVNNKAYSKTVY